MTSERGSTSPSKDEGVERSRSSGSLPDYYPYVAADILQLCQPEERLWIDLGCGEGPVALALAEHCQPRFVLVDPNDEALAAARRKAVSAGFGDRVTTLTGRAEALPVGKKTVDLVVSRGSIYFWDDQSRGLAEIYRVLRKGGQAIVGGGLGQGYPQWARQEFIRRRHQGVREKGPEAYERFLRLRDPETFEQWARQAHLPSFEVFGEGGRPPEHPEAGLGIWLLFERQE